MNYPENRDSGPVASLGAASGSVNATAARPLIRVALYQPEIPPNTGNVIRLCANSGAALHLVRPLGFTLEDAQLRRAGLDYHEYARLQVHDDLDALRAATGDARWLAFSTRGLTRYDCVQYRPGDVLLFGPETRGLPAELLDALPAAQRLYLPQQPGRRSLNLSNTVAIAVYEAWRQLAYAGAQSAPASS
ncbi:MAG: tRNA (cytidine(34)-2'-O)-methyltransferase [Nevskia sp.]